MLAVRCEKLVKRYGDIVAVAGLDLEVREGECFGLLGPNGAGKTTTVEILEGLSPPTSGHVEIFGRTWSSDRESLRECLGVMPQTTALPEKLTVREAVGLFRSFFKTGLGVDEAIGMVALSEKANEFVETLSGGQQQRLSVACAMVGSPKLLFLDEPTAALDPQSRRTLWDVIQAFKERGGSVVLTTHHMEEAERLCDRVGIVDHGKMIALGSPADLIASLGGNQIIEFSIVDATPERLAFASDALCMVASVRSSRVRDLRLVLAVDQLHVALPTVFEMLSASGQTVTNVSTHRSSLEDVFMTLTGRALRD